MLEIASAQNATFKKFLSLTTSKGLKKEKLFLLSGEKLIREFLKQPHLEMSCEIVMPKLKPLTRGDNIVQLAPALFNQLDVLGTGFNILALAQPEIKILKDIASHKPRGIELVLPVSDPGNLGALIRSAEAFAVPRVILTQEAAHPFLPKAVKASAGSVLRMPLARGPALREFPNNCIALDMDGEPIGDFKWPANGLLAVGEEGAGFGGKKFTRRVSIPTQKVQSLNVVVAASIALASRSQKAR